MEKGSIKMAKKVSIIVPVYNMDKSLEKSVSGLLAQTYQHLEVILVDDGSTDNSLQVCHEIAQNDKRVKVVHTENQGSGPARNAGIEHATGDYAYFMDADDHIEAEAIEVLVSTMEREQCDLVVFGHQTINPQGETIYFKQFPNVTMAGSDIRENYGKRSGTGAVYDIPRGIWDKFFDLRKIKDNNIIFPNLRRHETELFVVRYLDITKRVSFIDKVFYTYCKSDMKKMLEKYPVNYIDVITASMQERIDTIAGWNPENKAALKRIELEFVERLIRAMELSFNKSTGFNKQQRLSWLRDVVERAEVQKACAECHFNSRYLSIVSGLIKTKNVNTLYYILRLRVLALLR